MGNGEWGEATQRNETLKPVGMVPKDAGQSGQADQAAVDLRRNHAPLFLPQHILFLEVTCG